MPVFFDESDEPVELGTGRGDLRFSSQSASGGPLIGTSPEGTLQLINKVVSYGQIFATQPMVAAAVQTMLLGAARIPLKLYRREDDDNRPRVRQGEHPLADALHKPLIGPNRYGSQIDLILSLFGQMEIHGSGPAKVKSGAGDTIEFQLTDWRDLTPERGPQSGRIRGWIETKGPGLRDEPILWSELLLPHWWNPLDEIGISPLQQLGTTLSVEDAVQRHSIATWKNGSRPMGAVKTDVSVLPADPAKRLATLQRAREDIEGLTQSPDNSGRFLLLPPGTDWVKTEQSAVEAELVEQRKIAREEIIAVYHVPPPMLGLLDDATLANHQAQREMFYTDCLGGPLTLIEQTINATVLRDMLQIADEYYVEFDFSKVLRGDPLKEIQAMRLAVSSALLTPNEGRSKLNLPRSKSPEADKLFLPGNNLRPLEDANEEDGRGV